MTVFTFTSKCGGSLTMPAGLIIVPTRMFRSTSCSGLLEVLFRLRQRHVIKR